MGCRVYGLGFRACMGFTVGVSCFGVLRFGYGVSWGLSLPGVLRTRNIIPS